MDRMIGGWIGKHSKKLGCEDISGRNGLEVIGVFGFPSLSKNTRWNDKGKWNRNIMGQTELKIVFVFLMRRFFSEK